MQDTDHKKADFMKNRIKNSDPSNMLKFQPISDKYIEIPTDMILKICMKKFDAEIIF